MFKKSERNKWKNMCQEMRRWSRNFLLLILKKLIIQMFPLIELSNGNMIENVIMILGLGSDEFLDDDKFV